MDMPVIENSIVNTAAVRLQRDIRSRGLAPGDRYLTGVEAGLMLGVSAATANRAMSLLVDREVLIRRRRSGTFVGPQAGNDRASRVRSVYVLVVEHQAEDMPQADLLMRGIREGIPGANVHFGFLPETHRVAFVKDLLGESIRGGQLAGVVPISCGRGVYQYLMEQGIPSVAFGSLFTSGGRLTSIDVDNREMGRLLVEHLAKRGHRRIVIVDNSRGCPGDNHFGDGASEAMTSAGLPPNAALIRFLPDIHSVFSEIRRLLSSADPPTGFVARSLRLANMVEEAAKSSGTSSDSLEIVFLDHRVARAEQSHFTRVQPTLRLEEIATLIGRTLHRLGEDPEWKPEHVVVPVELCHPCGTAEGSRAATTSFGSVS
jgi:DNA-binding LacI/PurR family transcriptional regulator